MWNESTIGRQSVLQCNRCGYLLVWSWRLIVTGRGDCPLLAREFEEACGCHAGRVFAALCGFLCALARARRRRLVVAYPGCPMLANDEDRMLALVAAAREDHRALLDAHLAWISRPEARAAVEDGARQLATALGESRLGAPRTAAPSRVDAAEPWALAACGGLRQPDA